jgi:hypothetical protein
MANLRKTPTVLFTLLLCWSAPSYSEEITYLDFDCRIRGETVLGVVDGEPKNYSGVNGSYGVGDRLQIRLTTADDPSPKVLFFHLNWNQDLKDFGILILEDLEVHSDRQGGVIPTKHSYLYFKKDEIKIEKIDTTISLHRYYKSDHDGFIVNGPTFGSQNQHLIRINSVDCRTETNNLMDLLQYGKLKTE